MIVPPKLGDDLPYTKLVAMMMPEANRKEVYEK